MKLNQKITALIIAGGLTVTLSSCSNPIENMVKKGVESAIENVTGSEIDIDLDSGSFSASLPSDWPDVPTPNGKVSATMKIDGMFNAVFQVDQAEVDRVLAEFEAQGYEKTTEIESDGQAIIGFTNSEWTVGMVIGKDGDSMMMAYNVTSG